LQGARALFKLTLEVITKFPGTVIHGKFSFGEMLTQMSFMIGVTLAPALLVTIPFGVILALQVGSIANAVGAGAFMGAAETLGIIREAAPMVTALLLAGAAGSAIAADLGARKVREEIDAMEVMGLDPLVRLVIPRVAALTVVSFFLVALVALASLASAYVFSVLFLGVSPGSFVSSISSLARVPDYYLSISKAVLMGFATAIISCYKGLQAAGGPAGVATGVSETVILEFIVLFAINLSMTQLYILITGGQLI
jgi:phospholipid/cholesterol/gamma-HCH transport system permease protein